MARACQNGPDSSFPAPGQIRGSLLRDGGHRDRPGELTYGRRSVTPDDVLSEAPLRPGHRISVYNEERELAGSVRRLHQFLATEVPYAARITLVDNASTDGTLEVARRLADELPQLKVIHLDAKGRGGALRAAWTSSTASVVAGGRRPVDRSLGADAVGRTVGVRSL